MFAEEFIGSNQAPATKISFVSTSSANAATTGPWAAPFPFAEQREDTLVKQNQDVLACRGLSLPRNILRRLDRVGIFAQPHVSLEHQHLARRYVVRGIESGGAIKNLGRYVTFCGPDGKPLPYLHPIDPIGVNGVHAVVIAPVLVRVELLRYGRTCQLLITRHEPGAAESGRRPSLESGVLFSGVNGFLDSSRPEKGYRSSSSTLPSFWTRGGEKRQVPPQFVAGVLAATKGASCVGCSHMHFSVAPTTLTLDPGAA